MSHSFGKVFYQNLVVIIYLLISIFIYSVVLPYVNYMWKREVGFSIEEVVINFILTLIIFNFIMNLSHIFKCSYLILFVFIFIPIVSVSTVILIDQFYIYYLFTFFFIAILNVIIIERFPLSIVSFGVFNHARFKYLIFLLGIFGILFIILKNFNQINTSFFYLVGNVYDIRESNPMTLLESYISRFLVSIVIPILLFYCIVEKNKLYILFTMLLSFTLFSIFALKIQLLYFFLYSFVFYLVWRRKLSYFSVFIIFSLSIIAISFFLGVLGMNLLDRFLYLPALLNLLYLDFFTYNELNMFQFSKLEAIFGGSSYTDTLGYIVDGYYFGGGMNANTGLIGSMYAELGFIGGVLSLLILNVFLYIFRLIDSYLNGIGVVLTVSLTFEVMNAPITNVLLSNGFILVFLLPFFLKAEAKGHNKL